MFHVEFRQDGRTLNVRDGQTIAWSMKINDDLAAMAAYAQHAEALNIYGFDHATGLWVKEEVQRSFTPSTGIITTESTHFSHKNVDGPSDSFDANSCLNIRVVDEKGNQVNGADIRITGSGAKSKSYRERLRAALLHHVRGWRTTVQRHGRAHWCDPRCLPNRLQCLRYQEGVRQSVRI